MKYVIESPDIIKVGTETEPTYLVYFVDRFMDDDGNLLQKEDFIIGRSAVRRQYVGADPLFDTDKNWLGEVDKDGNAVFPPDPSLWIESKHDMAGDIEAVINEYIKAHPEIEDVIKRTPAYKEDNTWKDIEKSESDPSGYLSDPDILVLIGVEKPVEK